MDIVISNKSVKPIYEQIYDQIVSQIVNGELTSNVALPSIRVISAQIGVSVITVKKAWELLEKDGFIYTRAGIGCFVGDHLPRTLDDKRLQIAEERFAREVQYYKDLGLSKSEMLHLVEKNF